MIISVIKKNHIDDIAHLMARIKPDWWDFDDAKDQLTNIENTAKLKGWFLAETEDDPLGWILCAAFEGYSYLSIECLGFNKEGIFVMEEELESLLKTAEKYAIDCGYRNLKYIISSTDMSCHGKPIINYAEELANLKSLNRKHFDYFYQYGFRPTGFIPHCYGENYHGIIMIKSLI